MTGTAAGSDARLDEKWAIAVTATFTAEPVLEPLAFWMDELGFNCQIEFAPYNQVFQQLLDPVSLLAGNRHGLNVVLLRLEDWWRGTEESEATGAGTTERRRRIERQADDLLAALDTATTRSPVPYLVCFCPASQQLKSDNDVAEFLAGVEARMAGILADSSGVHVITHEATDALYGVAHYEDPQADQMGHVPFTQQWFDGMGSLIARRFYRLHSSPRKVLVLDCDQTLWRGICGEDGPTGVTVDSAGRRLQEFALQQRKAGVLICLCSKNNEEDVWAVFAQNPGMILERGDIVASRINWQPKSENLRELAHELQLGLDSFALVDDSGLECAEVQARCPEVLTLQIPDTEPQLAKLLAHVWDFDHLKVTAEDQRRSELYAQNVQREQVRRQSLSLDDFLAGLELHVDISSLTAADVARVAQITQRTNQFNFTTSRRSETEVESMRWSGSAEWITVRVRDRFGDYGLVGTAMFDTQGAVLEVDNVMLSCRALGRRVEHQMLSHLDDIAESRGLDRVLIRFATTTKNVPAQEFLKSLGADFEASEGNGYSFEFPVGQLAKLCARTPEVDELRQTEPAGPAGSTNSTLETSRTSPRVLERIARELNDVEKISSAIAARHTVRLRGEDGYQAPETSLEESLVALWAENLNVDKVGIRDNFFELGGDSLLAMRVVLAIRQAFNADFSLEAFLQSPVPVAQAQRLEDMLLSDVDEELLEQLLSEMDSDQAAES